MARGVLVDEEHTVATLPKSELAQQVMATVHDTKGCALASATLDELGFVRSYRPLAASIAGWSLCWTLVGALFLLIRSSERFSVVLLEDHRGLRLHLTGRIVPELRDQIATLAAQRNRLPVPQRASEWLGGPSAVSPVVAPDAPVVFSPQVDTSTTEPRTPASAVSRSARPEPARQQGPEPARVVVLRPAVGSELVLDGKTLVGRNPQGRPDEAPPARSHRVDDLSVSKTHASFEVEGDTVWVTDRNSSNGTTIIDISGVERRLVPGRRERAAIGQRVRLGTCEFSVAER